MVSLFFSHLHFIFRFLMDSATITWQHKVKLSTRMCSFDIEMWTSEVQWIKNTVPASSDLSYLSSHISATPLLYLVLATGPGNLPVVQVQTAKTIQFNSIPVQHLTPPQNESEQRINVFWSWILGNLIGDWIQTFINEVTATFKLKWESDRLPAQAEHQQC